MQTFKRILHPTDFSDSAADALAYALDLAVRDRAELELLHVVADEERYAKYVALTGPEEESLRIRLKEKTIACLGELSRADLHALHLQYTLIGGRHPESAILEHLARNPVDLVAMGTHGRRGVSRLLLGSVAETLVQESPCPVFTVRRCEQSAPVAISQVLVPIDFSEPSEEILTYAKRLAALYDAELLLLFVAEEHIVPHFIDTGIPTFTVFKMEEEMMERAKVALQQMNKRTPGLLCETRYEVRTGQAAHTILTYAKEQGVDLIVMATRGLSGRTHGLLGSVANHVVRAAPCPVFTLKGSADGV